MRPAFGGEEPTIVWQCSQVFLKLPMTVRRANLPQFRAVHEQRADRHLSC